MYKKSLLKHYSTEHRSKLVSRAQTDKGERCCPLQQDDSWFSTESSPSSCVMACQHQLHYISMTGVAQGSQGGLHQAGNTFLFPQSEIFAGEISDNCTNKSVCRYSRISVFPHPVPFPLTWMQCGQGKGTSSSQLILFLEGGVCLHWTNEKIIKCSVRELMKRTYKFQLNSCVLILVDISGALLAQQSYNI